VKATPKKNQNPANRTSKSSAKPAQRTPQRNAPSKKTPKDVVPKNEVKEMFMNWFKKHNQVGQIMSKQDVVRGGIMEVQEDGVTLVLTAKGAELLA